MNTADKIIIAGTLALAIAILLWGLAIDQRHARNICEQKFSPSTCTHSLR